MTLKVLFHFLLGCANSYNGVSVFRKYTPVRKDSLAAEVRSATL